MMAADGPVPLDRGNAGTHDAKTTQSDSDTSTDMSYDDVCAVAWRQESRQEKTKRIRDVAPWKRS